jgi:hypothetical protein
MVKVPPEDYRWRQQKSTAILLLKWAAIEAAL